MDFKGTDANGAAFVFDCALPLTRVNEAEILESLRRYASERVGQRLTVKDYDRWPGRACRGATVIARSSLTCRAGSRCPACTCTCTARAPRAAAARWAI